MDEARHFWENRADTWELIASDPNSYYTRRSLLTVELANEAGRLLANLGDDRVVFGTGMPFHYPDPALAKLELLDVSESVKQKIRRQTAAGLLGI